MMVLLLKHVHLQKEVAAAASVSIGYYAEREEVTSHMNIAQELQVLAIEGVD